MNNRVGEVISLFISKPNSRVIQNSIDIDSNGVINDKFYAKDPQRSVLITTIESYELANSYDISVEFGEFGENILIDYNPYFLKVGSKIKIGSVVLEISQNCTLCKSFAKIDKRLPKLLKDNRGIFAKVIDSGVINSSDIVYI